MKTPSPSAVNESLSSREILKLNTKHIEDVITFSRSGVEPSHETVRHDNVLSGEYKSATSLHFSDEQRGFISGEWEAGSCRETFTSEQVEFCHILYGHVRLTDENGNSADYGPGESFVIPAGFSGVWENISAVRKLFVIA